ncbi:hypothetical protein D3C87_1587570 [compost metagenome]
MEGSNLLLSKHKDIKTQLCVLYLASIPQADPLRVHSSFEFLGRSKLATFYSRSLESLRFSQVQLLFPWSQEGGHPPTF